MAKPKKKRRGITYHGEALTHDTDGLPGYPAIDLPAKAGTPFLAPEDGKIVRQSGRGGTSGNVFGWSIYFRGVSGRTYFITHLGTIAPKGNYKAGQRLGTVSAWTGGGSHAHVGINDTGAAVPRGQFTGDAPPTPPEPAAAPPSAGMQAASPMQSSAPPNAPPSLVPPQPEVAGSGRVDPIEQWRLMAAQPLASPETKRWAGE